MPTFRRLVPLLAALLACGGPAGAQPDQNPPVPLQPPAVIEAPPSPPATLLPTPAESLNAIGRLFGGATDAAGDVAKGVGDAAGTVARLPLTNVVSGKEMCVNAPNGAPDCAAASLALCRSKGFQRGGSLDITSAYRCPAGFWAERREPNDKECINEAFVSKAVCQ